ncbi:MAG: Acyl-CoA dehydrogenase [Promethearchaeota archaeon]|nr:MAG: Acyl-CoA dehydrogenase [Candidatus Lokiarchaeota archaeon]
MENRRFDTQAINDEILEAMSLKNRYNFLNNNLMSVLSTEQFKFLRDIERFCMRFEKKNNITHGPEEDIYEWIPEFGKKGYITRTHAYSEIDENYDYYGATADFLRILGTDQFSTMYVMASGATILAINPVREHHDNVPVRLEALKDMVTGKSAGAILITEPERGSDATHMLTECEEQDDGSFILNGTKIYNTNAPKADWVVAYATTEKNNANQMAQFLIDTSWEGFNVKRVYIPWVPKLFLGKEELVNLKVPKEYVLGGPGRGKAHLFEGLIPERLGIAMGAIAQCWGAVSHAAIYSNMREQMGREILKWQGVGFLLTDFWAKTTNLTLSLLKFCEAYDEKVENFGGEHNIPANIRQAMVASASQLKYHTTLLSKEACYEMANLMGGAGVCDNTAMHDYMNISRIQEVVGGTRQIQQYIMSMALRTLFKMSV